MKLTQPQRAALQRAADHPLGVVEHQGPRGLAYAVWDRMMQRLAAQALAKRYVHGGYEITDAGRAALEPA